jgi:hypothetical protein
MGKNVLEKYEQSTTDDVYIFQSTPSIASKEHSTMGGHTEYNVKNKSGDGKFHVYDMEASSDMERLTNLDRFHTIEGLPIQDKSRINSYIVFNPQIVNSDAGIGILPGANPGDQPIPTYDNKKALAHGMETVVHEFLAYIYMQEMG